LLKRKDLLGSEPPSTKWSVTSGSLFANGGAGWTGVPDAIAPNATSSNGNHSAVFRLVTQPYNFGNVSVSFSLLNQGMTSTAATPPLSQDGVHIFLRHVSQYNVYYASINRRDNKAIIKKKVPGGISNNGTYYDLSPAVPYTVPYNTWQEITANVKNNIDGSVTIQLYSNGNLIVSAVDNGTLGGAPITVAGNVGLRADNDNIKFKNFVVTGLGVPPAPTGVTAVPGDSQATISWKPVAGATSYNLYRSRTAGVNKTNGFKIVNVISPKLNTGFVNGTRYYMVVTAVNSSGESLESTEVSVVPGSPPFGGSSFPGASATDLGAVRVYPNPWKANLHMGTPLAFDNLTFNSTIKIFTIAGALVTTLHSEASSGVTWDLTNESGENVASGLYIYLITNDLNQKTRGTVAVVR
jgi:hypothetical protein